ncbi:MAG: 5-methylcytosine-specific restriction endonuclease system specificity protein McrC [Clostridium argentinense]|uniref:5-methylcytosine-specific restriction endonuclease system specificity protein McrC n=1 Tax=Clostridium tepidum TaxID=1962263 RepID=UPI001D3E9BCF|nr:5-methylcytosine-specific restriction endonuclease system specificity protein McrC [Clostridium tepidum]MBS5823681.1 5-methylcytosine-specific restriction endonuclease system specificity protein McrC [Clostridium argentinense]MCR1934265.1 5-methylcytosine-specific restriction endonuclease system specificity protein McrC [Clostridium tepidum]
MTKKIPIRNIYYMLSYAYDVLKEGDNVNLSDEEFDNIYNLFAKILINGLNLLIKRGFNKEYVCVSDELPVLRGKVSINDTLKRQSFIHGKISCEYDELSSNVLFNQIIKTTIITLINYKKLDKQIKNQLIHVNRYFQEVDAVRLQKSHFSRISYHRNNRFYKLILDICELIFDEVIVTSQKGETIFKDFIRDNRMAALYEKFILNFYKKELTSVLVYSPIFQWQKDDDFEHVGESFLPVMRTDIVLQNKERQLIIDAKYYTNALQIRNVGDTKKLISGNLYQIYTYINNSTFTGEKAGMLIYPVVDTELDFVYSIQGQKIYVKTLNLNTKWEDIYRRLKEIAEVI